MELELGPRIDALTAVGWDADSCDYDHESFEALVHELAHNVILGDLTPKNAGGTSALIRSFCTSRESDLDEILTTAVTIQVCETHYGAYSCTDISLESVGGNVRDRHLSGVAHERAIELLNTPPVLDMAQQLFQYIESLMPR